MIEAMPGELLTAASAAARFGDRPALIGASAAKSFSALAALVASRAAEITSAVDDRAHASPIVAPTSEATIIEVLAHVAARRTVALLHPRLLDVERAPLVATLAERALDSNAPPLAIFFTSGTTGRPKGAMLSARAFVASARAAERALALTPDDRWLLAMPLAHVGGFSILTRAMVVGCGVVLPDAAERFDLEAVIAAIDRSGVTIASVVPTMLHRLLARSPRWVPPHHLRALVLGGAGAPATLLHAAAERGWPVLTTYGLTEAAAMVTLQPLGTRPDPGWGAGVALEGVELAITPSEGASDGAGVLRVRGPSLMDGYLGVDRAETFDEDGWLSTGDVARLDEHGRLHVLARRTDLIVRGGENVYPAEIEDVLLLHPDVAAACVFGVADEEWGETVAGAIVARDPSLDPRVLAEDVRGFAAERLAAHKRPRRIAVVKELALLANGKVDRRATKECAAPHLGVEG